jgi:hypothetical protein
VKTNRLKDKNMKNVKNLSMLVAAVLASTVAQQAQANSLVGDIEFMALHFSTDKGSGSGALGTFASPATEVNSITSASVTLVDGDYSGLSGLPATFNTPIVFTPPTPDSPLWTVVDGLDTYIFSATSQTAAEIDTASSPIATTPVTEIQFGGLGWAEEVLTLDPSDVVAGPTSGSWSIQLEKSGSLVTFQAGSTTTAPDGGLTVALLGGAMTVMTLIRRRVAS